MTNPCPCFCDRIKGGRLVGVEAIQAPIIASSHAWPEREHLRDDTPETPGNVPLRPFARMSRQPYRNLVTTVYGARKRLIVTCPDSRPPATHAESPFRHRPIP